MPYDMTILMIQALYPLMFFQNAILCLFPLLACFFTLSTTYYLLLLIMYVEFSGKLCYECFDFFLFLVFVMLYIWHVHIYICA